MEIHVGLDPIDLRWGFDRLRGVVGERVGRDARGASLFVFFGRRRDALGCSSSKAPACACSTNAWTAGRSASPRRPAGRVRKLVPEGSATFDSLGCVYVIENGVAYPECANGNLGLYESCVVVDGIESTQTGWTRPGARPTRTRASVGKARP